MNNYSTTNSTNNKKSDILLSEQKNGQRTEKITLQKVKEAVKATNKVLQSYNKTRIERNRIIRQFLLESDSPDKVLQLTYEIKISAVTIYNILHQRRYK